MSYSAYVNNEHVADCTYNVCEMFVHCFESGFGVKILDGATPETASLLLNKAIYVMNRDFAELEKFEPKNGWGSREGAIKFLQTILTAVRYQIDEKSSFPCPCCKEYIQIPLKIC